jgi:DNA-directed RNA polymerase specialized sigma24 family protein
MLFQMISFRHSEAHLREFEEFSYHEINTVFDCPAGTAMLRPGRARAKLRELLSGDWERRLKSGKAEPA